MVSAETGPKNPRDEDGERLASVYVDAGHVGAVKGDGVKLEDYRRLAIIAEARLCKEDRREDRVSKCDRSEVRGTKSQIKAWRKIVESVCARLYEDIRKDPNMARVD